MTILCSGSVIPLAALSATPLSTAWLPPLRHTKTDLSPCLPVLPQTAFTLSFPDSPIVTPNYRTDYSRQIHASYPGHHPPIRRISAQTLNILTNLPIILPSND
ncbi:MAG: hypothetical protein UZ01_00130 [Candidatus Brocadia sinica]|nr:MAG: hypothetical protein UZ01_00130 [Candidatus Brocadia sinica]